MLLLQLVGPAMAAVLLLALPSHGRTVQFSNALPRITFATDYPEYQRVGEIIDSHSNVIVHVNDTFFLYGE